MVYVYVASCGRFAQPPVLTAGEALLSQDERRRAGRFRAGSARTEFVVGRILLRLALSRHSAVAASQWVFASDLRGRPYIAAPIAQAATSFNLSHSRGIVVCAIAPRGRVGVDVAWAARASWKRLVDGCLSAAERRELDALPEDARRARFFALWALKEAYLKARGVGLSVHLRRFGFSVGSPICVHCAADFDSDGAGWRFVLESLGSTHVLAIAHHEEIAQSEAEASAPLPVRIERDVRLGAAGTTLELID